MLTLLKKFFITITLSTLFLLPAAGAASAGFIQLPDYYADCCITTNIKNSPVALNDIDVTIKISHDESARVAANYELMNDSKETVTQEILIPFFSRPLSMKLTVDGAERTPDWNASGVYYCGLHDKVGGMKTIAIPMILTFKPDEVKKIRLIYERKITSYGNCSGKIEEMHRGASVVKKEDYPYKCVYVSSTGYSWNRPVRSARISFLVSGSLVNSKKEFTDFSQKHDYFQEISYWGNVKYTSDAANKRTESDGWIEFSYNYDHWWPKYDLGVSWILPFDEANFMNYFIEHYSRNIIYSLIIIWMFSIIFRIAKRRFGVKQ